MSTDHIAPAEFLAVQPRVARTLSKVLERRTMHALMLTGPADLGAHEIAISIAEQVLCPNNGGDDCDVCRRVRRQTHPDLIWVTPEGKKLLIDQMRDVVHTVSLMPFEAAAQVVVLEDADSLNSTNPDAGNTLLKVLEEPTGDVVWVLLAGRPSLMLPTIRSRVLELELATVATPTLVQWLLKQGVTDDAVAQYGLTVDLIARMSLGRPGRALELAHGGSTLDRHRVAMKAASELTSRSESPAQAAREMQARLAAVDAATRERAEVELERYADGLAPKDAKRFKTTKDKDGMEARIRRRVLREATLELRGLLEELGYWYRDLMAVHADQAASLFCADRADELRAYAQDPAAQRAVAALDAIEETQQRLPLNVDMSVALDSLCAELYALSEDRTRARRTIGAPSRTPQGVDLALG